MSITPMPDFEPLSEGIHLSALDAYDGKPGALAGVGFWPRAAARVVDTVVHYGMGRCGGYIFGHLALTVVRATRSYSLLMALRQTHLTIGMFIFSLLGGLAFANDLRGRPWKLAR